MLTNLINKRRSIREYTSKAVPIELIHESIDAARLAPSGCNAQPALYYVADKEDIEKLRKLEIFYQEFVYSAQNLIVCCGNPKAYENPEAYKRQIKEGTLSDSVKSDVKEFFRNKLRERVVRDVSIASSYLILRATELGFGTCYVGWFKEKELCRALKLSKNYVVPFVIVTGYPKQIPKQIPRKKLEKVIMGGHKKNG